MNLKNNRHNKPCAKKYEREEKNKIYLCKLKRGKS